MNLINFEKNISETIVDRGFDYFIEGLAVLKNEEKSSYCLEVLGSSLYTVLVTLGEGGEIMESSCDCPYSYGPYCKHEVAAFFELQAVLEVEDEQWDMDDEWEEADFDEDEDRSNRLKSRPGSKSEAKVRSEADDLNQLLNKLSKEELIAIIEDVAGTYRHFKNDLVLNYAQETVYRDADSFQKQIDSIVDAYVKADDFLAYNDAFSLTEELRGCLEGIGNHADAGQGLEFVFIVLRKCAEIDWMLDDSEGFIAGVVLSALSIADEIVEGAQDESEAEKERLFYLLLHESKQTYHEGLEDVQYSLLLNCTDFADDAGRRQMLVHVIQSLKADNSADFTGRHYYNESLDRLLLELHLEYSSDKERLQFMEAHMEHSSFREARILELIRTNGFEHAAELAEEGEEKDAELPGLVMKWKKLRYEVYKAQSMAGEQRKLAEELFLYGEIDFYDELMELVDDKEAHYARLKEELKKGTGWRADETLRWLIERESDYAEMLAAVKADLPLVEKFGAVLIAHYPAEVESVYSAFIMKSAAAASSRSMYRKVCGQIRLYQEVAGEDSQRRIVEELQSLYKKKPAFLDELSKI